MRRLGTVERAAGGVAVVRVPEPDGEPSDPPDIGTEAVDERLTTVGRVVDVFGPVERPYLAVTATDGEPARLLGTVVYGR
ncbi:MAG: Gar1/Naf1 family protein [Haloferacaceae archaeon]|jgi:RNA-binding protein